MTAFMIPQPIVQLPGGSVLPVLPSYAFREPKEGKRYIPVNLEFDGSGSTYNVNVQGLTTQTFSQIVMLDVDNSQSGAPVTFYFPDSSDTLVVPAESGGLFPVFTGALQIYVAAPSALASDIVRFRILNYRQEPIANPPPQFSQIATANNLTADGTHAVIASTVSGTLTGYSINAALNNGSVAAATLVATLKDHATGNVIDEAAIIVPVNSVFNGTIMAASDIAVRFAGGIDLVMTGSAGFASVVVNASLRYRTP